MIDNTSKRMQEDPAERMSLLAEGMVTGSPASFIKNQERDGQRQLVNSDRLPADRSGDFEALGFTFGDPDPDDPLFCPATLPEGWAREGSDHAMWSYILDPAGHRRAGVFYKAAFYDRKAHMHLIGLDWYVTQAVEYDDGPIVFDDRWATREAVAQAMRDLRDQYLRETREFQDYAADVEHRDAANRARCAEIAAEKEAAAQKYTDALAKLAPGTGSGRTS